ncbi:MULTISPECIES: ROK family protein [unclassified Arthrobacter]|uniref:ROK family protein n=1 Tax=unclassified Arthrobacter TaxID=235627 RepID=UPI001CFF7D80|nr:MULTISPECIES: ROK family protein [unclassified Arthrobacter]MCB5283710.1 N-acetylmannosamine kinase [Arthrobacter sp. ES1]WGZ80885.1 ROK family protein [Arthrobacter sp. EM1]
MRIGIDIGGTKTAAVVLDDSGEIAGHLLLPTGYGEAEVVATALAAVKELTRISGLAPAQFESIGVGIPGAVDAASGRVSHAVNLGLHGLELGGRLSSVLGTPVHVENDVNATALAAFHLVGTPSSQSMAYLNLGTGLAAGLILNGELWRGSRGTAGELGHIPVDPNGPLCTCGQHGCLEVMASGSAVARQWPTDHPRPVQALFEAAEEGNEMAISLKAKLAENIALAVRVLVLTVDVDTVVIGGGLSSMGTPLLRSVQAVFSRWADTSAFVAFLNLETRVRLLPDDFPAAAVGAALIGLAAQAV